MVTKEDIKATMERLLETFPRLKEDIIEDRPFNIRKNEKGWVCSFRTKYNQFDQYGLTTTYFDDEGNPYEISVSDFGRPMTNYLTTDENGNFIPIDNPNSADL